MKFTWKEWSIMFSLVSIFAFFVVTNMVTSPSKDVVNKDVAVIKVTDHSRYVIDAKRNLCFYETFTDYLATSIPINCSLFAELF